MPGKTKDVIDAVDDCEKHQCKTIAVYRCEDCPSFYGSYESISGNRTVVCIYPDEMPDGPPKAGR